jgi:hypothetical protein
MGGMHEDLLVTRSWDRLTNDFERTYKMSGDADAALERLMAEEKMDVSDQLQSARLSYFSAMDSTQDENDLSRAKFTCAEFSLFQYCLIVEILHIQHLFLRKCCELIHKKCCHADAWCLTHQPSREDMKSGALV